MHESETQESEKEVSSIDLDFARILSLKDDFLSDLESTEEMIEAVLPRLKDKDKERHNYLDNIRNRTENADGELLLSKKEVKRLFKSMRKLNRAESMLRQSAITNIVSKFDNFLFNLLEICFKRNPNWLKNSNKQVSYIEILESDSIESFKEMIIKKEVEILMRDSHYKQITFIDEKLHCGIKEGFKEWQTFLEITERRNLFVHSGGLVTKSYIENCSKLGIKVNEKAKEGKRLQASDNYINKAIHCFYELSIRLTQAVTRRLFPNHLSKLDDNLLEEGYDLLVAERWQLAEQICHFTMSIPDKHIFKKDIKLMSLVNLCIARKNLEKPFKEELDSIYWESLHPIYHLALAVLEDRFDDAGQLIRNRIGIREDMLKEWPLFRDFRETEVFKEVFKEVFSKDYEVDLREETLKEIEAQQDNETEDEDIDRKDLGSKNSD